MGYSNKQMRRIRRMNPAADELRLDLLFNDMANIVRRIGQTWYVDALNGSDGYDGLSWATPLKTMAAAFAKLQSGDTIVVAGKIREQLTTPVQVFDVTIIGAGNRPRHADAAPAPVGGSSASTWTVPASNPANAPLVKVLQQGWRFINMLFAGPTNNSCVLLYRDGGAGDAERDASHAEFHNCRFASGQDGIEQSGGAGHVGVYDCFFTSLTGTAIKHTGGAGVGFPIRWVVEDSRFTSNANIMTAVAAQDYKITGNTFITTTTLTFNFTGGARNVVAGNYFNIAAADFDPAGGVTGTATDVWSNTLLDAIETGLPAN
jgi:hypothetical protein